MPAPHLARRRLEDERVTLIQRALGHSNLSQRHLLFCAFDAEHVGLFFGRLHMIEATFNTTLPVGQSSKHLLELGGFMSLYFTMLNGRASQKVVGFYHFIRSSTILILGRFSADPNVNIAIELIFNQVRVKTNVRITRIETAVVLFWPRDNLELLDSPDLDTGLVANGLPSILAPGRRRFDLVIKITADQSKVGFFP